MTYEEILQEIEKQLKLRFESPTDPGLHVRRRRLRELFGAVPASRSKELYLLLGETGTGNPLSVLFHGRLATPTRKEMLGILRARFAPSQPAEPAQPDEPEPDPVSEPVWYTRPLPASAKQRFLAALDALERKVEATSDPRNWRYRCWFEKLRAGGDDRVIQWHHICPATSGALGAAYVVGPCDISAGMPVDQATLESAIRSIDDVVPASERPGLGFITYLRSDIVVTHEMISESFHLEHLRRLHDDVQNAIQKLDFWANNPVGGSSAMPRAYVFIKDWIGRRQRDANSLYSCL